jgi:hypothetical protein
MARAAGTCRRNERRANGREPSWPGCVRGGREGSTTSLTLPGVLGCSDPPPGVGDVRGGLGSPLEVELRQIELDVVLTVLSER